MGTRVHGAASACLVTLGLFFCGLGGALAIAQPPASSDGQAGPQADGEHGKDPKDDPKATDSGDPTPSKGGNPDNGNCGNGKPNGNAQGCGGGTQTDTSGSPSPPTITKTTRTKTSTKTTTQTSDTTSETPTSSTDTSSVGVPAPVGGGGGGGAPEPPAGRGLLPPRMQLPPEMMPPTEPSVIDSVPGAGAPAVDLAVPPITLPVIVAPAVPLGAGGSGGPVEPVFKGLPRGVTAEPPAGREPLPANAGSNVDLPEASYRIGYTDYLRKAGLSQVAALAVPGLAGMLVLTGAGGLVGYRQAKAGHAVHTNGTARFVN